jgi:hypothetical protein
MLAQKMGKPVRIYILEDDKKPLEILAATLGLSQTSVVTMLLSTALKARIENGIRMPLPLKLKIAEETKPTSRR